MNLGIEVDTHVAKVVCVPIGKCGTAKTEGGHYGGHDVPLALAKLDAVEVGLEDVFAFAAFPEAEVGTAYAAFHNDSDWSEVTSIELGDETVVAATELASENTGTASLDVGHSVGACEVRDWYGVSSAPDEAKIGSIVGAGGVG